MSSPPQGLHLLTPAYFLSFKYSTILIVRESNLTEAFQQRRYAANGLQPLASEKYHV